MIVCVRMRVYVHVRGNLHVHIKYLSLCEHAYMICNRPDMTFAVDWVLRTNYLSIYMICKRKQKAESYQFGSDLICEN